MYLLNLKLVIINLKAKKMFLMKLLISLKIYYIYTNLKKN